MIVMHYNHRLIEQKGSIAHKIIQELSGRKHIARKLCTLYVEGIYTVFQKKFTLLPFAITKSDVDRFQ